MKIEYEKIVPITSITIGLLFILIILYCFVQMILSNGEVTHCYIHHTNQTTMQYRLYGFREYRSDLYLGIYNSFEEAVNSAKLIECHIK